MKKINNNLLHQALSFVLISGVGWLFDFITYFLIVKYTNLNVMYSNMISAIPAFTYVFTMSNKKIFKNSNTKMKIQYKYLIYFVYQIILVTSVSFFGEILYNYFIDILKLSFLLNNLKIIIKLLITPITMTLNFIIMKTLIEKI